MKHRSKKPLIIIATVAMALGATSVISPPTYAAEENALAPVEPVAVVLVEDAEPADITSTDITPSECTEPTEIAPTEPALLSNHLAPELYAELTTSSDATDPDDAIELSTPADPNLVIDLNAKIVLIDISEQHVWAFENGVAVLESPIVSGTADTKRETSRGIFAIANKVPGKYLRGPGWKCWVDYWMPFDTKRAIGLHDASWRESDEFNPETYLTDGSRGCVNLPCEFAPLLYDFVEIGTPVIVQD